MVKFETREEWLDAYVQHIAMVFAGIGRTLHGKPKLPAKIRVTCGFTSGGTRKKANSTVQIGECWDKSKSGDQHFEIFVSPAEDDVYRVAAILSHELIHATVGISAGHGKHFEAFARALKLEGPLPSTHGGMDFRAMVKPIIDRLGDYPHSALDISKRVVQSTRMLKCVCPEKGCGYAVRTSQRWLSVGLPRCTVAAHGFLKLA